MTDQMRDAFNRLTAQGHMIGFSDFETGWEQCIAALGGDQLITMLDETRNQLIASMAKRERQRAALERIANGEVLRDVSDGNFTALQALAEYQRFAREAIASAQHADHIGDVSEMVAAPVVPEEWRQALLSEFPLFDDNGLDEERHHCEWTLQHDRKRLHALLAAPAPEQREKVELTDAEIEERWWGELDNRSLSSIRAVIAAHEAKRVSCSQTAKKSTHEVGRVDETGKSEHVGGAA